jgi:hypothetical protein
MTLDALTEQAIKHTLHCLLGCSIGEVLGMAAGEALALHNIAQTALAVVLAFFFGYLLTFRSFRRAGSAKKEAFRGALATDTASITSMEIIDNVFIWIIPGAINATLGNWLFWWSLALSLIVAFIFTVPINRFIIKRSKQQHHH